jgi:hypothetical protein
MLLENIKEGIQDKANKVINSTTNNVMNNVDDYLHEKKGKLSNTEKKLLGLGLLGGYSVKSGNPWLIGGTALAGGLLLKNKKFKSGNLLANFTSYPYLPIPDDVRENRKREYEDIRDGRIDTSNSSYDPLYKVRTTETQKAKQGYTDQAKLDPEIYIGVPERERYNTSLKERRDRFRARAKDKYRKALYYDQGRSKDRQELYELAQRGSRDPLFKETRNHLNTLYRHNLNLPRLNGQPYTEEEIRQAETALANTPNEIKQGVIEHYERINRLRHRANQRASNLRNKTEYIENVENSNVPRPTFPIKSNRYTPLNTDQTTSRQAPYAQELKYRSIVGELENGNYYRSRTPLVLPARSTETTPEATPIENTNANINTNPVNTNETNVQLEDPWFSNRNNSPENINNVPVAEAEENIHRRILTNLGYQPVTDRQARLRNRIRNNPISQRLDRVIQTERSAEPGLLNYLGNLVGRARRQIDHVTQNGIGQSNNTTPPTANINPTSPQVSNPNNATNPITRDQLNAIYSRRRRRGGENNLPPNNTNINTPVNNNNNEERIATVDYPSRQDRISKISTSENPLLRRKVTTGADSSTTEEEFQPRSTKYPEVQHTNLTQKEITHLNNQKDLALGKLEVLKGKNSAVSQENIAKLQYKHQQEIAAEQARHNLEIAKLQHEHKITQIRESGNQNVAALKAKIDKTPIEVQKLKNKGLLDEIKHATPDWFLQSLGFRSDAQNTAAQKYANQLELAKINASKDLKLANISNAYDLKKFKTLGLAGAGLLAGGGALLAGKSYLDDIKAKREQKQRQYEEQLAYNQRSK